MLHPYFLFRIFECLIPNANDSVFCKNVLFYFIVNYISFLMYWLKTIRVFRIIYFNFIFSPDFIITL